MAAKTNPGKKKRSKANGTADNSGRLHTSSLGTGRYGQRISSRTIRDKSYTFVQQTYGLSPKSMEKFPKVEPEQLPYKTDIPFRIALINEGIKACRAKGDLDAVRDLNEAKEELGLALRAKKPENRKAHYAAAKRLVLYAKQKSRAIANRQFFSSAGGNKI